MFDLLPPQAGIPDMGRDGSCKDGCGASGVPRASVCAKGKEKVDELGVAEPGCAVEDAVTLPNVRRAGGDGAMAEDFDDV
jgi:hypothetical protein